MLKKISFIAFSVIIFLSCADKEHDSLIDEIELESPENKNKLLPITLTTDISNQNIYGMVVFKLQDSTYQGPNESIALPLYFSDALDSLIWEIEGNAKKMNLVNKQTNSLQFTTQWGHYFYLPGEYKTFLHGYKGKDILVKDSNIINISANGDFLNVKWNQLDENINKNIGFTNNGTLDYSFQILTNQRQDVLFSKLNVRFDSLDYSTYNTEIGNRELEVLSSYITALYGPEKYDNTNKSIDEEFKRLFTTSLQKDQVLKIWEIANSNIALIKKDSWQEDGFGLEIHAEPNKL